ncbi:MAG: hypothetical protein WCA81_13180 [Rhizomicrobium sp.]
MKRLHIALAILCTLFAAACLPVTSKTPVGTTTGLGTDTALYGTWKGYSAEDHTLVYLHVLRPKNNEAISAVMVGTGTDKDEGTIMLVELRTAALGDNHFMNVIKFFTKDENGETANALKDASIPLLYRFGKNHSLTLYLLDEDKTKEAIAAGKLQGTVESGNFGDVKITSDAAALDAFMATPEAAKLFKLFVVLKKAE